MSLENEFSRPVRLIDIAASPVTRTIEADKSERTALALRLDLIGLERFEAATRLERSHGGRAISVVGRLKAAVTYRCCVTLKPFSAEIDEAFEAVLALDPELMGLTGVAEEQVEIDEDSPEEFIAGDTVNLGEIATQYLALA
ncbi:MAG: hypothetical protein U9N14_05790, partial [Pseudomonadota bacterium]|nr:hypothetical protein [Pseudomonadota bacterium]